MHWLDIMSKDTACRVLIVLPPIPEIEDISDSMTKTVLHKLKANKKRVTQLSIVALWRQQKIQNIQYFSQEGLLKYIYAYKSETLIDHGWYH